MIKAIENNKGKKRYYRYSQLAMRWLPVKASEAELLLASGEYELVSADTL